jgi:hypothetical protein
MNFGNITNDGGLLILKVSEAEKAINHSNVDSSYILPFLGSQEFIRGIERRCIWVLELDASNDAENKWLNERFESVKQHRSKPNRAGTKQLAAFPFGFSEVRQFGTETVLIVPSVSSESREYLPVGYCNSGIIASNFAFALYDAPLWNMALIASRLHLVWIATVCGKLKTTFATPTPSAGTPSPSPASPIATKPTSPAALKTSCLPANGTSPPRSPRCTTPTE